MIDISKEVRSYTSYLRLCNFKRSTVEAYSRTLWHFYEYHKDSHGDVMPTQDHVQSYLLYRLDRGLSWSSINADYSSLRKYFKQLKDYDWSLKKLPRPRRDHSLPGILSKEQVGLLISHAPNYKYQVFLSLLYATGMRLSEATHLRISDIDSDRMQIRIHLGKGGKTRFVSMPEVLLSHLREYYRRYRPEGYIFYGRTKSKPYSPSAARWAIRRAKSISGITTRCSIHTLRNCYATHHLELGTDLVYNSLNNALDSSITT